MNTMHQATANDFSLRRFLGADIPSAKCRFLLPHFKGVASLEGPTSFGKPFVYKGFTVAERDSRAAFYVHSLVADAFDPGSVFIESATAGGQLIPTAFLFGSRSNVMMQDVLQASGRDLFEFEFGSLWKIHCAGNVFSMADPNEVTDPNEYQNTTDYAVIARLHTEGSGPVFVIAGLGGRATEGAAQFFVNNWGQMAAEFGEDDFCQVLQFDAPFQLHNCRIVSRAHRSPSRFRYA